MHIAFLIQAAVSLLSVRPVLADSFRFFYYFIDILRNYFVLKPSLLLYTVVYPCFRE